MQKLEVLIEENAFGSVRPVEIVADVPIAVLVPALVEELRLPQNDVMGRKITYMLYDATRRLMLPEQMTLLAAGIRSGMRLALNAYPLEDIGATVPYRGMQTAAMNAAPLVSTPVIQRSDPTFYSSMTLADASALPAFERRNTSMDLPVTPKKRGWTRRALLLTGGVVLGAGAIGFGYEAYASVLKRVLFGSLATNLATTHTVKTQPALTPQQPALPTTAKPILTFTGHQQTVRSLSWSADGTQFASGADDARLLIWGMDNAIRKDIHLPAAVRAVAWSPTGQALIAGSANQVIFLDAQTGKVQARSTRVHHATVTSVAWTAHNQMQAVSGSLDTQAAVWNTNTHHAQEIFRLHTAEIEAATWASDGQTIATASHGGVIRVWNAENGQELHGLYMDTQVPMRAAAFAPSGGLLAVGGDDGTIRIWNGLNCQMQGAGEFGNQCMDVPQRLQVSKSAIHSLAWSPDARFLLAGSDDNTFTIWYPAQGQKPLLTMQQNAPVLSVVWSPNSNQIATASGKIVTVWQLM